MTVDPMSNGGFAARSPSPSPSPSSSPSPRALAANADRDRAIDVLNAGFAEGRLTKSEHDDRVARACAARTYGELGALVADLPAGPFGGPAQYPGAMDPAGRPPAPLNGFAVASLACGIGMFFTMGATSVLAIGFGHAARRAVRRTGERGETMALAGLALGWAGVALIAVLVVMLITIASAARSRGIVINPGDFPGGFPARPGGPLNGG